MSTPDPLPVSKVSVVASSIVQARGPQGIQGSTGPTGERGATGDRGATGADGTAIVQIATTSLTGVAIPTATTFQALDAPIVLENGNSLRATAGASGYIHVITSLMEIT